MLYENSAMPAYTGVVPDRPRIREMMLEAVKKPITTVMANIGFGKTKAVSTLLESSDNRVIWLQLTRLDNLAPRLWERLCYGIGQYNETLSEEFLAMGFPEDISDYQRFFRRIAERIERAGMPYVLVLDDFHVIYSPKLLEMIELAAAANIGGLSFVLVSKEDPKINLIELKKKGLLSSVTQDDLRLTKQEIADFYETENLSVSEEALEQIYEMTYGWCFAVYLAGLSLARGVMPESANFKWEMRDVFTLMEDEIYQTMPEDARRLLLRVAHLNIVPLALMKELSGKELLTEVERRYSSFLLFDRLSGSYRIMTLFRNFLLEEHDDMSAEEVCELHHGAAEWHRANGDKIGAMSHYNVCRDYANLFEVILTFTHRCPSEVAAMFINLIDGAPPEEIAQKPVMLVARVRFLINNRRLEEALAELARLREEYEGAEAPDRQRMLGEICLMSGIVSLVFKTLEFVEYFQRADALLPEGSQVVDNNLALVAGASFITTRDMGPGSVKRFVAALFEGMPHAARAAHGCGAGLEYLVAAEADYMTGDIKNAEKNAYAALYKAQPAEQYDIEYMAQAVLLRIAIYQGDYKRAAVTLETVNKHFKRSQTPDCNSLCDITISGFYAPLGRCDQVAPWILKDTDKTKFLAPISFNQGQWIRARCLLHSKKYNELLGYLDQLDELYSLRLSLLGLIENAIMRAIAHHYSGDREQAMDAFYESYRLSYENGIIMLHVEFGKWMRTLVRAAKAEKDCPLPAEWLDMIYNKASTYARRLLLMKDASGELSDKEASRKVSLSRRETDVLEGMCQGLTRAQIAEAYGLSINTIKAMIPNIFGKLGATNTLDAVRIAASMDLFG